MEQIKNNSVFLDLSLDSKGKGISISGYDFSTLQLIMKYFAWPQEVLLHFQ